jgi:multicomponent K+:H+ antiporter subunit D
MLAGLPPLAGFVGKLAMFSGLAAGAMPPAAWAFILVLTLSSLGTLMPLVRLGTLGFWVPHDDSDPVIGPLEFAALAGLLGACLVLTLWAGAALAYTDRTVAGLSNAAGYIGAVLGRGTP